MIYSYLKDSEISAPSKLVKFSEYEKYLSMVGNGRQGTHFLSTKVHKSVRVLNRSERSLALYKTLLSTPGV